ncbi:MAG: hypothetical protein HRF45_03295 [Fimbriimonadia bacterium]|jgi:CHASE2 domain-containing sensor protein
MRIEPIPEWIDEARFGLVLTVTCALWTGVLSTLAVSPVRRRLLRLAVLGPICYLTWRAYLAAHQWLDITSVAGVLTLVAGALLLGVAVSYFLFDRHSFSSAVPRDHE